MNSLFLSLKIAERKAYDAVYHLITFSYSNLICTTITYIMAKLTFMPEIFLNNIQLALRSITKVLNIAPVSYMTTRTRSISNISDFHNLFYK